MPSRTILVRSFVVLLLSIGPAAADRPVRTTTVTVPGLAEAAEIRIDPWGIPHITAGSPADAYFVQGFDAARLRLWQIDFWRRRGLGRLSSVLGPGFLGYDRAARLFLDRTDPAEGWARYDLGVAQTAAAFTAGINAWIDLVQSEPRLLPPEFEELGYRPEKWLPEDLLRIRDPPAGIANRVFRAELACNGGLAFDELRIRLTPAWPIRVPEGLDPCAVSFDDLHDLIRADEHIIATPAMLKAAMLNDAPPQTEPMAERLDGSNAWAIAPSRTTTGRPILAHDPHTSHEVPSLRLIVQVTAPGLNFIGAGYPQEPGISRGHNDRIAWGTTDFAANLDDLYVYETNPDDPNQYRYGSGWESMHRITETVAVRGSAPVTMTFKYTRHGPVLAEDPTRHRAVAVGFTPGATSSPALFNLTTGMYRAVDWPGFLAAVHRADAGNYVYAGTDGTIAWAAVARVPVRPNFDGLMPIPGDGRYEHRGLVPNDDLLTEINPARGWIASANEMNLPPSYPLSERKLGFEWPPAYRHERIAEILSSKPKLGLLDNVALQNDVLSLPAQQLVPLLGAVRTDDAAFLVARRMLERWDCRLTGDSAAAALFEVWDYRHLRPLLLAHVVPPALLPLMGEGDIRAIITLLQHPDARLGSDPVGARDAVLRESLAAAMAETRGLLGDDPTRWRWSALHRAAFRHPFSQVLPPVLRALADSDFGGKGGDTYTVMATWVPGEDTMDISGGASFAMVLDVGAWDNSVVLATQGESGVPGDEHYRDLYPRWLVGAPFPLIYSPELVEQMTERRWQLQPAP